MSWRPYFGEVERVHCSRTGQGRHVPAANLITIVSLPRWVTAFHQVEVLPCGHCACSDVEIEGEPGPVVPGTGPGLAGLIGQQRGDQPDPPPAQALDTSAADG